MLGRLLKGLFAGKAGTSDERGQDSASAGHLARSDLSARLNDEGVRFYVAGHLREAAEAFQRAIKADGANADALANLGIMLARSGKIRQALEFFDRSLAIRPGHAGTLANYAFALREAGRYEDAIRALRQVLQAEPQNLERWCDLAVMHKDIGELVEARHCCERVLTRETAHVRAHALLGGIAIDAGRFDDAEQFLRGANPFTEEGAMATLYRAFLRLGRHEFAEGWEDYQSRKWIDEESPLRPYPFSQWRGESLAGRRLLIYAEQGLGDEIMFASCIPNVATQAEQIVLECDPRLARLFSRSFPANVQVVPLQRNGRRILPTGKLGSLDFQVPAGDLPRYFRRITSNFPSGPFLFPDPERVAYWRARLDTMSKGPKLGVAWRGGLGKTRSRVRSLSLDDLAPLLTLPGFYWFSLQFRSTAEERESLGGRVEMGPEFPDFDAADYADLAAFLCALDGVVSVCSSAVHFAGALGVPTWVLAPFVPEWRYGFAGETMPWYSSIRLLRQEKSGDWPGAVMRLAGELTQLVS